jgi:hypothetical protein
MALKYNVDGSKFAGWLDDSAAGPMTARSNERSIHLNLGIEELAPEPRGAIDPIVASAQPFTVSGWALDQSAALGTGIDLIHVYAYPQSGKPPLFVGVGRYGVHRYEPAKTFGRQFENSGWTATVDKLPGGSYTLVVFGRDLLAGRFVPWTSTFAVQ